MGFYSALFFRSDDKGRWEDATIVSFDLPLHGSDYVSTAWRMAKVQMANPESGFWIVFGNKNKNIDGRFDEQIRLLALAYP